MPLGGARCDVIPDIDAKPDICYSIKHNTYLLILLSFRNSIENTDLHKEDRNHTHIYYCNKCIYDAIKKVYKMENDAVNVAINAIKDTTYSNK
ncbi:MAG: hypothetical protein GY853_15780 [PVC group bacterium]|nr:hypothetical protein [PVC group bacterium]